jgi:hypothetical protein
MADAVHRLHLLNGGVQTELCVDLKFLLQNVMNAVQELLVLQEEQKV